MRQGLANGLPRVAIPQANSPVVGSSSQEITFGRKRAMNYRAVVVKRRRHGLAGLRVPNPRSEVKARTCKPASVRRPLREIDKVIELGRRAKCCASLCVGHPDFGVAARC